MASDEIAKPSTKPTPPAAADSAPVDHSGPAAKTDVKTGSFEAHVPTPADASAALTMHALDLAYRPKANDSGDKGLPASADTASNDKVGQYLKGSVADTFKQFQNAVVADKQLQEQAKQLIQLSGEYDKLQKGSFKGDQVVDDHIHPAQTVDQLKETLKQEYAEKSQGFPERQKALYDQWVKVVSDSDHLKLEGSGSPTDALNGFLTGADGSRRRELLDSLGIPGNKVTMDQLQTKSTQIDEALKADAAKPALPKDQKDALELQAKNLKELIPLQQVNDGLQFMVHAPSDTRVHMAQILNSGELGDKLPPNAQALASYRLTIEASTMDPTGSISKSPEYAKLLSDSSKNLLALTQIDGKDNPNMKAMLDSLQTALTTPSKDPATAGAAFQAATEASKKLDISAFSGDLRNQRDSTAFTQMYAKMLGVETVKEAHAKFYLDQGHVDKSLSILTDLSVKTQDILTMDYTNLNSNAPKGNVAFDKLMQAAVSRPDLPLSPDSFLLNMAQQRSKGENGDNAVVIDNINKLVHSLDKVNFDDVKTSVDSMTNLLTDIKTREQSIEKNFTIPPDERVRMEKQLAIQSISVTNELNKEKTLQFQKEHAQYLGAFGNLLGDDAATAHEKFQAFADAHPEADLKASVKQLTDSVKDGQDKIAKIDQDPKLSDEMKQIKKAQAEADLQFTQNRLQQQNILLNERQQAQDIADKTTWWQRNKHWMAVAAGIAAGAAVTIAVAFTVVGSPAAPEAGVLAGAGVTAGLGGAATDLTVGAGATLLGAGATASEATVGTGALIAGVTGTDTALTTGAALTAAASETAGASTAASLGPMALRVAGLTGLKAVLGTSAYYGIENVDSFSPAGFKQAWDTMTWSKFHDAAQIGGLSAMLAPGVSAEFTLAKLGWSGGAVSTALRTGADTMMRGALVSSPLAAVEAVDNYKNGTPLAVTGFKVAEDMLLGGLGAEMKFPSWSIPKWAEVPGLIKKLNPVPFVAEHKVGVGLGTSIIGFTAWKYHSDSVAAKIRDSRNMIDNNVIMLPKDIER